MRDALENDAEDSVIGDLAAEGVESRENFIAFCLTSVGSHQNRVRQLRQHERVGEDGCGAVNDDETELIAPGGKQACHAGGGDQFGGAGRASTGVNDREQGKSGDGMGEGQDGGTGEHFGKARLARSGGGGGGTQIRIDKEH